MNLPPSVYRRSSSRSGVLLLICVSMLTLFMMLGTAYLVVATRAREAARAMARRTLTADEARVDHAAMLDNVLLTVVRGTAAGGVVAAVAGAPPTFEALLADRYGNDTVAGSFSGAAIYSAFSGKSGGPILTGTFTRSGGGVIANPAHLNGRVLTFTGPGRPPTSHRILRSAGSSPYSLTISNPPGPYQFKADDLPANGAIAIINGREFAGASGNEAWDGFDSENAYLAHVKPSNVVSSSIVEKPSYFMSNVWSALKANPSNLADNDNDGVADGVFLNFGLPSIPISSGTSVTLDASVLIVDLDSRFNVNAHGSLANMPALNIARSTLYAASAPGWTTDTDAELDRLPNVPLGSGVGPAEVNAWHLFSSTVLGTVRTEEEPGVAVLCGMGSGSQKGQRPTGSRFTTDKETLRVAPCEGRHGGRAVQATTEPGFWASVIQPLRDVRLARASQSSLRGVADEDLQRTPTMNNGVPPLWWLSDQGASFNWQTATADLPSPRTVYNSPPDIHGRMKTFTRPAGRESFTSDADKDGRFTYGIVPRVSFAKPEWSTTINGNEDAETKNNPYQTRLRSAGSRGGYIHAPSTDGVNDSPMPTNPFTLGELERLLRPYDVDTNQLPPRLVAMLGTVGEQMRTRLTSESWDTTGIVDGRLTGAWGLIEAALSVANRPDAILYGTTPVNGLIGGEIARGERFNLNRPLTGVKPSAYLASDDYYLQRQAYFKDLYTLLLLLGDATSVATAKGRAELAQWAANVVEFRDADSTMTPFEYDNDIFDGIWDADGDATRADGPRTDIVFGAERPEAILTHTLAWQGNGIGEFLVVIHRPWHSYAHGAGPLKTVGEAIDSSLDNAASSTPQNQLDLGRKSGNDYPVWRLRIVSSDSTAESGYRTAFMRFDVNTKDSGEYRTLFSSQVTEPVATPKMGTDSWLCARSWTNNLGLDYNKPGWLTVSPYMQQVVIDRSSNDEPSQFFPPGQPLSSDGIDGQGRLNWPPPRAGVVYLERLADPQSCPTQSTWLADPKTTTDIVRYVVVDQAPLQIITRSPATGKTLNDYSPDSVADRRVPRLLTRKIVGNTAFWRTDAVDDDDYDYLNPVAWSTETRGEEITVKPLADGHADLDVAWMPWPNRPFFSPAELLLVPKYSAIGMLENYRLLLAKKPSQDDPAPATLAEGNPVETDLPRTVASGTTWPILDAVTVPSLFAGVHDSWVDPNGSLAEKSGIFRQTHPVNQLSAYREPGRVNLNTVTNDQVWDAVVSGPLASGAVTTGTGANLVVAPAKSMRDILALSASSATDPLRLDTDQTFTVSGSASLNVARNPMHRLYTASRLANVATTRSNVFAIWVTLRQRVEGDPDSIRYHRAFYIVDRSIPVGFQAGQDHNVRDIILVRRIIE